VSPPAVPTVGTILEWSTRTLVEAGVPDPRLDAMALLAHALGTDRGGVVARKTDMIDAATAERATALVAERAGRRPLQQILGHAEFHGLDLEVDAAVLVPRPETEGLVDAVLAESLPDAAAIADLGTGSGCIAIALAVARPRFRLVAVDRSAAALAVARRNASRHQVSDRVEFEEGDFGAPPESWRGAFDAVVSNPPYVPEEEWRGLQPEVRDHEPRIALVPGPTGDEAYAAVVRTGRALLKPGGLLALELGWTSEPSVRALVGQAGYEGIELRPDLQGIPRVLLAHAPHGGRELVGGNVVNSRNK
jgi:release factor glutamine methyltransferase